jgi:glycosyltransferase involved in cell wall biosynthesis
LSNKIVLQLLRIGAKQTGGEIYELRFLDTLQEELVRLGKTVDKKIRINNIGFPGLSKLKALFLGSWISKEADILICNIHTSFGVLLSKKSNNKKIILIIHYVLERKSNLYTRFKWFLLSVLVRLRNVSIVTISEYNKEVLLKTFKSTPIYLIYNDFDEELYKEPQNNHRDNYVILGRYGYKNSDIVYELAKVFKSKGYTPIFLTPTLESLETQDYKVIHCKTQKDYIDYLHKSCLMICAPNCNEGWNRMCSEALLSNLPVIGLNRGGLGEQLIKNGLPCFDKEEELLNYCDTHY